MADEVRPVSWPYRADIPQRYNDNAELYLARGGKVRLGQDVRPFVADGDHGDISRFFFFCLMQDQIIKEGLRGDLAELGVYKGNTAALLATIARRTGRTAYLFDTFEGFNERDIAGIDADKQLAQFTDTSLSAVKARVGEDNVRYVQGYFPDTLSQVPDDLRFCLVHIDCDLYEPIKAALGYFYPRLVPGGFLVMHDYTSLAWNGAERAIDEFFADKPEWVIPLTDGAGSAVIRRCLPAPGLAAGEWFEVSAKPVATALRDGWSALEPWGVWGIGPAHVLVVKRPASGPLCLELDCAAALVGGLDKQSVEVAVDGEVLTTWHFTRAENRAVRRVDLPAGDSGIVTLTFLPRMPVRPSDHDPSNADDRLLGMALHRLRIAT